jgi:hypothetical protein
VGDEGIVEIFFLRVRNRRDGVFAAGPCGCGGWQRLCL